MNLKAFFEEWGRQLLSAFILIGISSLLLQSFISGSGSVSPGSATEAQATTQTFTYTSSGLNDGGVQLVKPSGWPSLSGTSVAVSGGDTGIMEDSFDSAAGWQIQTFPPGGSVGTSGDKTEGAASLQVTVPAATSAQLWKNVNRTWGQQKIGIWAKADTVIPPNSINFRIASGSNLTGASIDVPLPELTADYQHFVLDIAGAPATVGSYGFLVSILTAGSNFFFDKLMLGPDNGAISNDGTTITVSLLRLPNGGTVTFTHATTAPSAGTYTFALKERVQADFNAGYATIASPPVTVNPPPDTSPPTAPTNLRSPGKTSSSIDLAWDASSDNVGVTGYEVFRNNTSVGTPGGTSFTDTGLSPSTTYTYKVRARDAAGNLSGFSSDLSVTTNPPPPDTTPPSVPGNLRSPGKTSSSIDLAWDASSDNVGITGYEVFRNGASIANPTGLSFTDTGLSASTTYTYKVRARDAAGNLSGFSSDLNVTTNPPSSDGSAPSKPTNLRSTGKTDTTISLAWDASSDNVAVTGYDVFRNGSSIGTASSTSFTDTGLSPNTSYAYKVRAYDEAGNRSAFSDEISVVTNLPPGPPDTTAPSTPSNLRSTGKTSSSVTLMWNLSSDNNRVAGYEVYRNGAKIGSALSNTYSDSGLSPSTTYTYKVRAYDEAGNFSGFSNEVSETTNAPSSDKTAPSKPANLRVTGKTATSASFTWSASRDDTGVAGYEIFRDDMFRAQTKGTAFTSTGLSPSTTYVFKVRAYDEAGNRSEFSDELSVTTEEQAGPAKVVPREVPLAVSRDIDGDGNAESAVDEDRDVANGFEHFVDEDASTIVVRTADGDHDGKVDFFLDTNQDGAADIYWDPDNNVISKVIFEDVDGDGIDDWVIDTTGNGIADAYFHPQNGKVYPLRRPTFWSRYFHIIGPVGFLLISLLLFLFLLARDCRREMGVRYREVWNDRRQILRCVRSKLASIIRRRSLRGVMVRTAAELPHTPIPPAPHIDPRVHDLFAELDAGKKPVGEMPQTPISPPPGQKQSPLPKALTALKRLFKRNARR